MLRGCEVPANRDGSQVIDLRPVRARSHEAYAKNYSIVYVHDEPLAGRNLRRDPLHAELGHVVPHVPHHHRGVGGAVGPVAKPGRDLGGEED